MVKIHKSRMHFALTSTVVCLALTAWLAASAGAVQAAPQAGVPPTGGPGVSVPVLMYHHIGNPVGRWPDSQFYVSPAAFDEQMAYLADDGFTSVSLEQVLLALDGDMPLPAQPVAITFDDGNQDNYDLALPVLEKYHLSATFLIVTGWVGKPGHLTWNEIASMQQAGMHFGAHTVSHPYLPFLPRSLADWEIRASKADLEAHLGQPVLVFAYPFGHTSPVIARLVQLAGFGMALGTRPYHLAHTLAERFFLTRYGVYSWTSLSSFERHIPAPARTTGY
jgi:peptidoglycan/xylan/chitin deacetylase (PgdA/CDA1 family)